MLRNIRIFLILTPNFNFFSFSKWGCAVTTAPEHYLYYHLRFLLTVTTVPRHPADTARASTKIAIFVLSPVFGELDTEVASELWETGVLPPWFSDVSGVSFSGAFSFVRSRIFNHRSTVIDILKLNLMLCFIKLISIQCFCFFQDICDCFFILPILKSRNRIIL